MLVEKSLNPSDLRTDPHQKCSKRLIKEAVAQVESGIRRQIVCQHYGIAGSTLATWMRLYGSEDYQRKKNHSFTPQQKRSILQHIEQGTMTARQAMAAYHITGEGTINKWQRQFRQESMSLIAINPAIMEQLPTPPNQSDPQYLQKALEEANLKIAALEIMIDLAEQQFKIKIRKKSGAKQSPK